MGGRGRLARCSGPASRPEKPTIAAGATDAAADMQRHHGALAEADQHQTVGAEPIARQLGVEEAVDGRPAATTPRQYSVGSRR
jgi:hypothetical protein